MNYTTSSASPFPTPLQFFSIRHQSDAPAHSIVKRSGVRGHPKVHGRSERATFLNQRRYNDQSEHYADKHCDIDTNVLQGYYVIVRIKHISKPSVNYSWSMSCSGFNLIDVHQKVTSGQSRYQFVIEPSPRLSLGGHHCSGSIAPLSAASMSMSTPSPGVSGHQANPSSHSICCGNRSVAEEPGLTGISWAPTFDDAIHRATQAAALTGPRGL